MLSRIAESLFWIGRYIERAEDTARILDVHIHHLLEAPVSSEAEICQSLLDIMGVPLALAAPDAASLAGKAVAGGDAAGEAGTAPGAPASEAVAGGAVAGGAVAGAAGTTPGASASPAAPAGGGLTARRVTQLLAFDTANPSSIASSLIAARANARGVSEAISSEMWEALNATYNALPDQMELGHQLAPYPFFRFVRERAAVIAGLTESTMSRDDAWRFLVLGRSLERVDMLARLLSTAAPAGDVGVDWVILLRSCSAHEAFLRTYRREPEPILAAEFLILDRLFPRSVFFALASAEDCLADLDPRSARAGMPDEPRRILGGLRTNLEFRRIDDILQDLRGVLHTLQQGCSAASAALAARYFRQTMPISWTQEGTGLDVITPVAPRSLSGGGGLVDRGADR